MISNPTFSRIANHVRESTMPADLKNTLLLLFYRMDQTEQARILAMLESSKESLPLFAELVTELEQNKINLNDSEEIEKTLEKYIKKFPGKTG